MTRRRRAEYTQEAPQVNGGKLGNSGYSNQIPGWDATVAREESHPYKRGPGEVPEWSIGTVSKTVVRASVPWVRIPPSPPTNERDRRRSHRHLQDLPVQPIEV